MLSVKKTLTKLESRLSDVDAHVHLLTKFRLYLDLKHVVDFERNLLEKTRADVEEKRNRLVAEHGKIQAWSAHEVNQTVIKSQATQKISRTSGFWFKPQLKLTT